MSRLKIPSISLLLALGLSLQDTSAQTPTRREQQAAACKGDALRLCAFSIPNEKKIQACMEKKIDQLSPRCRAMFKPAKAQGTKPGKDTNKGG